MAARRLPDQGPKPDDAVEMRIDTALKRAYQQTVDEALPSDLTDLLVKLKQQDKK